MIVKESTFSKTERLVSIFSVSTMSTMDGPGKRVVVFFQGCNNRCTWCHSPHSQSACSPLIFQAQQCVMCMRCQSACSEGVHVFLNNDHIIRRDTCQKCGRCIEACPRSSIYKESSVLRLPTKKVSVTSLLNQLLPYLSLCDGITLSGGEALLQAEAAVSFLSLCKAEGILTAVETSGLLEDKYYIDASPFVDDWLFGIRVITGKGSAYHTDKIMSAVQCIRRCSKSEILPRIPMVPGIMDREETLREICVVLEKMNAHKIWLNPWNRFFDVYYRSSGIEPSFLTPAEEDIQQCEAKMTAFFSANGYIPL